MFTDGEPWVYFVQWLWVWLMFLLSFYYVLKVTLWPLSWARDFLGMWLGVGLVAVPAAAVTVATSV